MFRLAILWVFFVLSCFAVAQETPIKPGDTLSVITAGQIQYSGDYIVSSDGTINIQVVGRFQVAGKGLSAIQKEVQSRMREYVRDANVTVILRVEQIRYVYLVSEKVTNGAIQWTPGMSVRQLVAKHPDLRALDSYVAKLYHGGQAIGIDLVKLMRDGDTSQDIALDSGDVLTLLPAASKSVWVVGSVSKPGEIHLKPDEGVNEAIAQAGGLESSSYSSPEITVRLRRGDQSFTKPLSEVLSGSSWNLNAGDTVSVELPRIISVTVGGFVVKPGEIKVRQGTAVVAAIQTVGGAVDTGTLQNLILFRKDESRVFDGRSLAQGGTDQGIALEDGDFVYVPENRREFHVFGYVTRQGRKLMPDSKPTFLADVLGQAEGLKQGGTLRHVVVLSPDSTGKFVPKKYDLDKYLKDADANQNPEIHPGDIVFFDQSSGTSLADILRIVPSLILLDRFF